MIPPLDPHDYLTLNHYQELASKCLFFGLLSAVSFALFVIWFFVHNFIA